MAGTEAGHDDLRRQAMTVWCRTARQFHPLPSRVFHDAAHATPIAGLHAVAVLLGIPTNTMDRSVKRRAPTGQAFPIQGQDTDHATVMFRNINDILIVDIEERRSDQFGLPYREQFAVKIEDLNPIVFAI